MRSASTTAVPRPTLMKKQPGFIAANAAASNRPVVSAFDGTAATTTSALASAPFISAKVTVRSAPGDGASADRRTAVSFTLNGARSRATSWLIGP